MFISILRVYWLSSWLLGKLATLLLLLSNRLNKPPQKHKARASFRHLLIVKQKREKVPLPFKKRTNREEAAHKATLAKSKSFFASGQFVFFNLRSSITPCAVLFNSSFVMQPLQSF